MNEDNDTPKRPGNLRDEAAEWFAIMRGPEADARREEFEAWLARGALHRSAYNKIAETFSIGKGLKEDAPDDADPLAPSPTRQKPGRLKTAGLALSIVGAVAALYLSFVSPGTLKHDGSEIAKSSGTIGEKSNQLQSKLGEIREVQLSDGSRVTLDTDSLVLTKFDRAQRDVRLVRGRARFDVEKDKRPFVVAAGNGTVTALGTSFDVALARDERVTVQLFEGSVDVRIRSDRSLAEMPVRLAPGQQLIFRAEKAAFPVQVTSSPITDRRWPEGVRDYDGVRLGDVVGEANRYATGPILVAAADVSDRKVSGTYRIRDVERLAENLADMLRLALIRGNNQLLLVKTCPSPKKENCTPPS